MIKIFLAGKAKNKEKYFYCLKIIHNQFIELFKIYFSIEKFKIKKVH